MLRLFSSPLLCQELVCPKVGTEFHLTQSTTNVVAFNSRIEPSHQVLVLHLWASQTVHLLLAFRLHASTISQDWEEPLMQSLMCSTANPVDCAQNLRSTLLQSLTASRRPCVSEWCNRPLLPFGYLQDPINGKNGIKVTSGRFKLLTRVLVAYA